MRAGALWARLRALTTREFRITVPTNDFHYWTTRGFESFRQGLFGNAGQNLYVSRAGVLQRIHQYDLNGNGYLDLLFCNSQNHSERPPAYVYDDPLGHASLTELAAEGAWTGTVADLNGDGYDDLVLGMWNNGIRPDLNATIYYGAPDGMSERRQQQLPVPQCASVAAADFDGDGRPDLAFVSQGSLRIFYQTELARGFEPHRFVDLDIAAEQLAAGDLDGDGSTPIWSCARDPARPQCDHLLAPDDERAPPTAVAGPTVCMGRLPTAVPIWPLACASSINRVGGAHRPLESATWTATAAPIWSCAHTGELSRH